MKRLPLDGLVFDDAVWPRVHLDEARVQHLADCLRAGQQLPPIKVQKGTSVVLGGRHTVSACRVVGEPTYFVEIVDVPPDERLLYAYQEDFAAALPYSDADVRSVAERLYQQRCVDGELPNVVAIAKDLGRSRQTLDDWLRELVKAREIEIAIMRAARAVAVQAFLAVGLSVRRIAVFALSKSQVSRDAEISIAGHLKDSKIVAEAHSLIHLAIGHGATVAEVEAARDWLIGQTDPEHLQKREVRRAWMGVASETRDVAERVAKVTVPERPEDWAKAECEEAQQTIAHTLGTIQQFVDELKARVE